MCQASEDKGKYARFQESVETYICRRDQGTVEMRGSHEVKGGQLSLQVYL